MSAEPLIHIVDDDPQIRESLHLLLESVAMQAVTYSSADDFLARFEPAPGRPMALLLDVRMPGMSGMVLLERLSEEQPGLPVIVITGHGDIDMAVRAMKLGAMDFISKPFRSQDLLDRIQEALRKRAESALRSPDAQETAARLAALTPREAEIFERIVAGDSNKAIALDLRISVRTVESHRASIMEKLQVRTLVDLVMLSVSVRRG